MMKFQNKWKEVSQKGIKVMTSAEVTKVNTSGKGVKLPSKQKMVRKKFLLISFCQQLESKQTSKT